MAKKKENNTGKIIAGASVAAATIAAAAGAYFLYGTKEGKKTTKKIKSWALKAKGEVLEKLENAKAITEDKYYDTVNTVMRKYRKLKRDHGPEVEAVAKELNSYWSQLKKHLKEAGK